MHIVFFQYFIQLFLYDLFNKIQGSFNDLLMFSI